MMIGIKQPLPRLLASILVALGKQGASPPGALVAVHLVDLSVFVPLVTQVQSQP